MTESNQQPKAGKKHAESLIIWILPLIALGIVVWMAYQATVAKGPTIEITFDDGQGLIAGKTALFYKGIEVGKVEKTQLSENLSQVIVTVRLADNSKGIAVEGSKFWIARPEISLAGIRGLDTLLSGVYIEVHPGKGTSAFHFQGLPSAPVVSGSNELPILLLAKRARSVQVGSPIYFRDIQVGQIKRYSLSEDGQLVIMEAGVESRYSHLVRSGSRFWNDSGIDVKASLLGVKIKTDSLETIIRGGVTLATPDLGQAGNKAEANAVFTLYEEPDKAWLEWVGATSPKTELATNPNEVLPPNQKKQSGK